MLLTAAERVLLHLLPLWNAKDVAREATQEGIAEGTGLRRSHVPRAVKRLVADASVDVREGRIRGRGRKVRVYVLTEPGIRRARELLTGLESEEVLFGDRRVAIGALAAELHVNPSEVVAGLDDEGGYLPRRTALAVPETQLIEREADLRALAEWLRAPSPAAVVYGSRGLGKIARVLPVLRGRGEAEGQRPRGRPQGAEPRGDEAPRWEPRDPGGGPPAGVPAHEGVPAVPHPDPGRRRGAAAGGIAVHARGDPAPPVLARGPGLTEGPDLHDAPRHGVVERAIDRALRGRHPAERAHDVEDAPEVVPH